MHNRKCIYLGHHFQLLALPHILALANRIFKLPQDLLIQRRRTGDGHLYLTLMSPHELGKILSNTLKRAESVVLGECAQEILNHAVLVLATSVLQQLISNAFLVLSSESGCL